MQAEALVLFTWNQAIIIFSDSAKNKAKGWDILCRFGKSN